MWREVWRETLEFGNAKNLGAVQLRSLSVRDGQCLCQLVAVGRLGSVSIRRPKNSSSRVETPSPPHQSTDVSSHEQQVPKYHHHDCPEPSKFRAPYHRRLTEPDVCRSRKGKGTGDQPRSHTPLVRLYASVWLSNPDRRPHSKPANRLWSRTQWLQPCWFPSHSARLLSFDRVIAL